MIERESLKVYQLSVFVLAVEWILFGSLHFTARLQTEAQIPPGFPWPTFIAVVTGMIEVTVGILLLITRTRKYAAIASLVLLAAFLPSIYRMLAYDHALQINPAWRDTARVLLVPNHVFMALCAVYLIRWPRRPAAEVPADVRPPRLHWPTPTFAGSGATLTVGFILLLANLAGLGLIQMSPLRSATAYLWALMCLALGGLFGFLFGVPRVTLDGVERVTHRPNSNIEVVSDWLTKIIVGVGLLQFHSLGRFLDRVSLDLGQALGGAPERASAFAKALIIYFFVAGLIQGYLLTRMYLAERFEEFETPTSPMAAGEPPRPA